MYNSHSDIWIAGAFAAVIVDFIVYPFDTLKTRIQSPNYERVFKDPRTGAVKSNVLFRGLYQGVWSVVFSTIPSSGAFFTTYEAVKSTLHNSSTRNITSSSSEYYAQGSRTALRLPFSHSLPTPVIHAIASSTAEMVSCLMLTPAEVLKQNAQMVNSSQTQEQYQRQSNTTAMREVLSRFKQHPWRLWSGYTALVGRNLPFTGLQFPMFEYMRPHAIDWRRHHKETHPKDSKPGEGKSSEQREQLIERAGLTGLSAAASGMVSSFVTTPIDVIKTHMMLSATEVMSEDKPEVGRASEKRRSLITDRLPKIRNQGMVAVGRHIYQNDGVKGLFKGGAIRAGWTAISLSLYLSLYEGGRFFLENRRRALETVGEGSGARCKG